MDVHRLWLIFALLFKMWIEMYFGDEDPILMHNLLQTHKSHQMG